MSGELKKRQAYQGYHLRLELVNGERTYFLTNEWNGFTISTQMAEQMKSSMPAPSQYPFKLTCKLTKGKEGSGVGKLVRSASTTGREY